MAKTRQLPSEPRRPFYDEDSYYDRNIYRKRILEDCDDFMIHPHRGFDLKGNWKSVFDVPEIELEIGCGKGKWIAEYARQNPDKFVLGMELKFKRVFKIVRKLELSRVRNVHLLRWDAQYLDWMFGPGELNAIHLYFPDPWTKKERQNHHRLTSERFFSLAFELLASGGIVKYKTDHALIFEDALEFLSKVGFEIERKTDDLHHSEWNEENIETIFESSFHERGLNIHYLMAKKP